MGKMGAQLKNMMNEAEDKALLVDRNRKNYRIINELQVGNYFGEIGAVSNLRRTSSVVAINSMLVGKIKISKFRQFMEKNANFEKKIRKKI